MKTLLINNNNNNNKKQVKVPLRWRHNNDALHKQAK